MQWSGMVSVVSRDWDTSPWHLAHLSLTVTRSSSPKTIRLSLAVTVTDPTGTPRKETFHPAPLSAAQLVTYHPRPFHLTLLPEIRCTSWYSVPALPPQSDFTNCRFALIWTPLFCFPQICGTGKAKHTGPLRIRGSIRYIFGYIDDRPRVGGSSAARIGGLPGTPWPTGPPRPPTGLPYPSCARSSSPCAWRRWPVPSP